ncbi:Transposase DDE domain protein (plasmid) [Streptomyces sp. YIM 121038]|nr:Transposase DDE domain protein [Streptomyces sp. YIM 121038]
MDFAAWKAVYRFFRRWQQCGFPDCLHDALRELARKAAGKKARPTAAIVDSQSVKASWHVAAEPRAFNGGKKVTGRKRHLVADTLGLLLVVPVTTADLQDRDVAVPLLARLRRGFATVRKVWTEGGYTGSLTQWAAAKLGLDVEIVRRPDEAKGFVLLRRGWIVERTLAWLVNSRRLARDYEYLPLVHEAMVKRAMIRIMARRVTAGTQAEDVPAQAQTPRLTSRSQPFCVRRCSRFRTFCRELSVSGRPSSRCTSMTRIPAGPASLTTEAIFRQSRGSCARSASGRHLETTACSAEASGTPPSGTWPACSRTTASAPAAISRAARRRTNRPCTA